MELGTALASGPNSKCNHFSEPFSFLICWLSVLLYVSEGCQSSSQLRVLPADKWMARLIVNH